MMRSVIFIFICAILFSCSKHNDTTSNVVNPPPSVVNIDTLSTGWTSSSISGLSQIYDIYFADNQTGYFLENSGVFKSTDGGHNWNKISNLKGVNLAVTPDGKVFFVNKNSKIYFSTNNGSSFDSLDIAGTESLTEIYFIDSNNGFAFSNTKLFHTTSGGSSWDLVQPLSGIDAPNSNMPLNLATMFFLNANTGWIAFNNHCYYTNNSTNDWTSTLTNFPFISGGPVFFTCIYATDANTVFLTTTDGKIYKSLDGGINFSNLTAFPNLDENWNDIQFIDSNTGYACYLLKMYKTTDAGNTWQPVVSMSQKNIIELYFKDPTHGWAVGDSGTVLIYHP